MSEDTIFSRLSAPFNASDLEWRAGATNADKSRALALAYITSRAVMDRLDEVVGPENWRDEYQPGPDGGLICGISLRVNGEWITKWDGAENTQVEEVKGGLSGAFKRAAVKWGIGRYLYRLENVWVPCELQGKSIVLKSIPSLPEWALPTNGHSSDVSNLEREVQILQELGFTNPASEPSQWIPAEATETGTLPPPILPSNNGGSRSGSWNAPVVKAIIASGLAENPAGAVKLLNRSDLPRDASPEVAVAWARASYPA